MRYIKFDIRERHNDVELEAARMCPMSQYDAIQYIMGEVRFGKQANECSGS